jgi:hypothetical protein
MLSSGYGYNASYVLKQNTQTDVVIPVYDIWHVSNSTNGMMTSLLTLPLALGSGRTIVNQNTDTSIGSGQFNYGLSVIGTGSYNGAWTGSVTLNLKKVTSGLSQPIVQRTICSIPTQTLTNKISEATLRNLMITQFQNNNCALSSDGKLLQIRLLASELDSIGALELNVSLSSTAPSTTDLWFPFKPTTFYVTADGLPPAGSTGWAPSAVIPPRY